MTSELGNLSQAMHWLGTCTAQAFNRRHERSGHLFQGRFGSRLVEDDDYLRELARYLPRNPVRAGMCRSPEAWPWSSYASTAGLQACPWFLDTSAILGLMGSAAEYVAWVAESAGPTVLDDLGGRRPPPCPALATLLVDVSDIAIATAHHHHGYGKSAIAQHLGMTRWQIERRLAHVGSL